MKLFDYLTDVRFFAYSPDLARVFSPTGAILLCWIIWKLREAESQVEATTEVIQRETGLSEKNVETAIKRLGAILTVTRKRLEHRTFYTVNADALELAWTASPERPKRPLEVEEQEQDLRTKKEHPTPLQGDFVPASVQVPVVRKARRNGSFTPASPEIRSIIQAFAGVYELRFRSRYVPNPKRDTSAALALVTAGLTPAGVAERFTAATRVRGFWSSKSNALHVLAEHWNEIGAEIEQARTPVAGALGTSEGDAAEWARSIEELPEVAR